jgi:hypothetical protein
MKTLRFVLALWGGSLVATVSAFGQPPDSLWSRTYGGNGDDICNSVEQTSDSGYVLAGYTSSFGTGGLDFWLVKTDADGESLWSCALGTRANDYCFSVQQTADSGYVLGGITSSYEPMYMYVLVIKIGANGDIEWNRTFGEIFTGCSAVQQTMDCGYIVAGYGPGGSDFWILKTDDNGDSLWSRRFGGFDHEICYSVQQTEDGGYILGGYTYSFGAGSADFWLVKTDAEGDSLWSRTYGGPDWDGCESVQQTADGGYILAGMTYSFGAGYCDAWLVKTNENGDSVWSRTFGGNNGDWCRSVRQTSDGGYVLGANTCFSGVGECDFWIVKTDADGDSVWSRAFGGNGLEDCHSVQQTSDGGYILAGYTHSFGDGDYDFWLVKTGPELPVEPRENSVPVEYALCQNYPNPFNPSTQIAYELTKAGHVSLIVYDVLGREVGTLVDEVQSAGSHYSTFDGSGLASGVYLYRFQAGDFVATKKMVLLR